MTNEHELGKLVLNAARRLFYDSQMLELDMCSLWSRCGNCDNTYDTENPHMKEDLGICAMCELMSVTEAYEHEPSTKESSVSLS